MVKSLDSGANVTWVRVLVLLSLFVEPWTNSPNSLSLGFHICIMELTLVRERSEVFVKIQEDRTGNAVSTWLVYRKRLINSSWCLDSHFTDKDPEIQRG